MVVRNVAFVGKLKLLLLLNHWSQPVEVLNEFFGKYFELVLFSLQIDK